MTACRDYSRDLVVTAETGLMESRDSETKRLVYLHRFRFEELNEMEWQVDLVMMDVAVK